MAVAFQLVIDCADPEPQARFWAAALGYQLERGPLGSRGPRLAHDPLSASPIVPPGELGAVAVRDSKDRYGSEVSVSDQAWSAFARGVKHGEFDLG